METLKRREKVKQEYPIANAIVKRTEQQWTGEGKTKKRRKLEV